jgi:hypothetical protein
MNRLMRSDEPVWRWAILLVLGVLACVACQPKDERPGFGLRGQPAIESPGDFRFTDGIEEIAIQTRTWYGLPHSTTIWCVQIDGLLYVGSYGWATGAEREEEEKYWERNVARNPEARLRVEGKLYDVTVVPVTDPELERALDLAYTTKYDMADVFGEELPSWWYYSALTVDR